MTTLRIDRRFRGPELSGNGGWVAGSVAAAISAGALGSATQVTLRVPPPLERDLDLAGDSGGMRLLDGDRVVAEAQSADRDLEPVAPVSLEQARTASESYPGFGFHPFPSCYVCGTDRPDGLRIYPGQVPSESGSVRVATPWTPHDDTLANVWAALDCSGGWAGDLEERLMVLGRMTARISALPEPGDEHVVVGEFRSQQGRKTLTASSLYSPDGELLGTAEHTWIAVDPDDFNKL